MDSVTLRCERSEPRSATARRPGRASFEARRWRAPGDDGLPLQRHPAVDEMRLAGNVARLVAGEKEGKRRDLLRLAEPAHGLAIDESLADHVGRLPGLLRQRGNALFERGRLDRARANGVAADTLTDEIGGDRLGEP